LRSSHCLAVGKMFQAFNAIVQMLSSSGSKVAPSLVADFLAGAPPTADPQGSHVMDCGPDGNVRTPAHLLLFCDLYRACANEICPPCAYDAVMRMQDVRHAPVALAASKSVDSPAPSGSTRRSDRSVRFAPSRAILVVCVCACFCRSAPRRNT